MHAALGDVTSAADTVVDDLAPKLEAALTAAVPAEFRPVAELVMKFGLAEVMSRIDRGAPAAA